MPSREQVWDAAAAVLADGGRVNQKLVLAALRDAGIKGTERTIAKAFTAWKVSVRYEPRPEQHDPPQHLTNLHAGFVKRMWDAAVAEADARLDDVRVRLGHERDAMGQLLDETHIRGEEVSRENKTLRARQVVMDVEIAELRKEVAHLRRTEFWDRVIREVVEILPEDRWMTVQDVARRLPPSLRQEALAKDKALTPGRLHKQMRLRDHHDRWFDLDAEKPRYRRRAGWTGITQAPKARRGPTPKGSADVPDPT
ncbi:hypothetical protein ASF22_19630 [Methylobacterium sp. Leaf87]|uniref:DNA-binding protein n=1 Tax=Methylobacterium sp. Leaf87 TaxID=1736243 RepID=UPI0006FC7732|nr:DNA-binding protein [Methylobacterium sp. Leaf87]KQO68769.1 hypothetical protein ASF22_19630 [Methylobacterium sp. Leaf87]